MSSAIRYLALGLFCITSFKGLYYGFTWIEIPLLAIMACLSMFYEYNSQNKKWKELSDKCNSLQKNHGDLVQNIDQLKTHVAGLKLGTQLRSSNLVK